MKKRYIFVWIAMCGLVATSLGILTNVSGLFFTPISEEFHIGRGSVSLTLTISSLSYAVAGVFASKIIKRNNMKQVILFGTAFIVGATALMSMAPNIIILYLLNIIRGAAGGIVGLVLVTTIINRWFVKSNGLVMSVAMATSGIAAAVFSPILSRVIASAGWRVGYLAAAGIALCLNLPAILFPFTLYPEDSKMAPYGVENYAPVDPDDKITVNRFHDGADTSSVSTVLLIMIIICAAFGSFTSAFPQHFPGVAGSYGLDAAVGATMLSICMVANSGGKILLGILTDRFGTKWPIMLYGAAIIAGLLMMLLIHQPISMLIAAALVGMSYSMGTVAVVLLTKDMFGMLHYAETYPKIQLATTIANAVGSSLIGFMYDFAGNYLMTILMMLAMIVLMDVVIFILYQRKQTY